MCIQPMENNAFEVSRCCFGYLIFLLSLREPELRKNLKQPLDIFLCVVVVLTSFFCLCPEVGLGFLLLSVQRLV